MIPLKGDSLFCKLPYSNISFLGSHPKSVRLCSLFLADRPRERDSEGLGDPAGEPKTNLGPLGVLQRQLHCHVESLHLPMWYLPDKLHAPLSLRQSYRIEVYRLCNSGPVLQGHPHCQDTPKPQLSSGNLQEKFGGTVTQFLLHCALKAKENFGNWTSIQPQVPVQRLCLRRMIVSHSSLLGVVVCNSFFFLGGRRTGCASEVGG